MKESGSLWIGDIPEDWNRGKLKHRITFVNGFAFNSDELHKEGSYPVIRIGDLVDGVVDFSNANCINYYEQSLEQYRIKKGDILIAMSGATVGKLAFIDKEPPVSFINQRVGIIRSNLGKYLFYYLGTEGFLKYILLLSDGTAQPNISTSSINNYPAIIPPKEYQKEIVSFLDDECANIDIAIGRTQASIEEYKKLKQAIITETVTKGIRPNRKMKDSGIIWVGSIPEEWSVERGKRILTKLERPVLDEDSVITCFRDGEVTLRSNRREEGFTFSLQEIGYQGVAKGDLVVHGMDGFAGAIGISDERGKGSPVLNVLDSNMNKRYIMYYLRSMAYDGVFLALATGIRVRSCDTNWNKLKELPYPIPGIEEQEEIAQFIDGKIDDINCMIASKTRLLVELESFKKSLIFEYVTGKKEIS